MEFVYYQYGQYDDFEPLEQEESFELAEECLEVVRNNAFVLSALNAADMMPYAPGVAASPPSQPAYTWVRNSGYYQPHPNQFARHIMLPGPPFHHFTAPQMQWVSPQMAGMQPMLHRSQYGIPIQNDAVQHKSNTGSQQTTGAVGKTDKSSKGRSTPTPLEAGVGGGSKRNNEKSSFSHAWLASSLKGHKDEIRDLSFSSNGKFIASCAEDNLIRRHSTGHNSATSDDVNTSSSTEDLSASYHPKGNKKSSKARRNRRQRKQQADEDVASRAVSPAGKKVAKSAAVSNNNNTAKRGSSTSLSSTSSSASSSPRPFELDQKKLLSSAIAPPLRYHIKLNLKESSLVKYLRRYVVVFEELRRYGYPVDSEAHPGCVEFIKILPSDRRLPFVKDDGLYTPQKKWADVELPQMSPADSGQGSGASNTPVDSDGSEVCDEESSFAFFNQDASCIDPPPVDDPSFEKQCVRCKQNFSVTDAGEYLTNEECFYHPARSTDRYVPSRGFVSSHSCCGNDQDTQGCLRYPVHVWNGVSPGFNGPFYDYVRTERRRRASESEDEFAHEFYERESSEQKVYALDCEMSYTGLGLEVTKITVINYEGQMVYEEFVRPMCPIVDYNTKYSGITERDISPKYNHSVKTLDEVQQDLLAFIDADTILIGHGLENDLRALRIVHYNVIDTAICFPHPAGFPMRRSLKALTKSHLEREIQTGDAGHCSFEDSRACLELMLFKVRKDYRTELELEQC